MNGLSLRVSAIKGQNNIKKNSEIRMDLIILTKEYDINLDVNQLIKTFSTANSVDQQIKAIREIWSKISIETSVENEKIIEMLTEIYFEAPLKHAVRNTIVGIFQRSSFNEIIAICLAKALQDNINKILIEKELSGLNFIINSLTGCLENFAAGTEAVKLTLNEVIEFLNLSTRLYLNELGKSISPATKNEISIFLHTSLRVFLTCLQQFSNKFINYNEIISISYQLMLNPEIPMDTKINCGQIISTDAKITGMYPELIQKIFFTKKFDNDLISHLCLCMGVVNTFEEIDLIDGFLILQQIGFGLKSIIQKNSTEPTVILGVSRALLQLIFKIKNFDLNLSERSLMEIQQLKDLTEISLSYSLLNLEHYIDSVRHLCKDILKNWIQFSFCVKEFSFVIEKIFNFAKNDENSIVIKCCCLSGLCSVLGVERMLFEVPDLIEKLLSCLGNENSNLNIINCYETFMMLNLNKIELNDWFDRWIKPLIENKKKNSENYGVIEILIKKATKSEPKIIFHLIKNCSDEQRLVFSCIGVARRCGTFDQSHSTDTLWKSLISYQQFRNVLIDVDDETKSSAFRLLGETHKTTEIFVEEEFHLISFFLEYNVNCQSPALRQQILGIVKNLLIRLKIVLGGFDKNLKSKKLTDDERIEILYKKKYHKNFLGALHEFCLTNLFVGANFSRRTLSLNILIQTAIILKETNCSLQFWSPEKIEILIKSLEDTYEINKQMTIEVLGLCPIDLIKSVVLTKKKSFDLAKSVKPNDSVTSSYFMEFLTRIQYTGEQSEVLTLEFISSCCEELMKGIEIAKKSLLEASHDNPLYGLVLCIRHLVSKINFHQIKLKDKWIEFIVKILKISKELTKVVAPIVNNSSPEGHFPNDFSEVKNYLPNEQIQKNTTPQMVLLCAWRTVKEVSLLLGDLSAKVPIGLITTGQLIEIGSHFTELLSETKHRGAFEQAFVGFSRLCSRLWTAEQPELHLLPMKWLSDLIQLISGDIESDKLCSTRRSAGVPFMVQALITSELKVCSTRGLQVTMKKLFELCKTGKTTESRTHSLNILRALFRCTDLGETIGDYISEGIECSIKGYDADSWAEKNSSTLLFSALMIRVFGVQRTKDSDNLNIRNKMTGRIFFLRYSRIYDFLLEELNKVISVIEIGEKSSKLHPMLLLLSRLYPSALEGSESNLKLNKFLPLISACSSSPELYTRNLAAKSIVAIISPEQIENYLMEIIGKLQEMFVLTKCNSNIIHGVLLQTLYLIRSVAQFEGKFLMKILSSVLSIDVSMTRNVILLRSLCEILIEIFKRSKQCSNQLLKTEEISEKFQTTLQSIKILFESKTNLIGKTDLVKSYILLDLYNSVIFHDKNLILNGKSNFILYQSFNQHSYEYSETIMNLILLIINFENRENIAQEFEFSQPEIDFVEFLETGLRIEMKNRLIDHEVIGDSILTVIADPLNYFTCSVQAFTLLSYSPDILENKYLMDDESIAGYGPIDKLLKLAENQPDQLRTAIFKCVSSFLLKTKLLKISSDSDLGFLYEIASPGNSDDLRKIAAEILNSLKFLFNENPDVNMMILIDLIRTTLMLLQDDNSEIRCMVSTMIMTMTKINDELSNSVASFAQKKFLEALLTFDFKFELPGELIGQQGVGNATLIYIVAALGVADDDEIDCDDDEIVKVFDKNESNGFGEKHLIVQNCLEVISPFLVGTDLNEFLAIAASNVTPDVLSVFVNFTNKCCDDFINRRISFDQKC